MLFTILISTMMQSATAQLDADGWAVLTPSADSRMIYVSSLTGIDTNDGLSEMTPKKTIKSAVGLLRNGFPDWLMLKSGETFIEGRITFSKGGRSSTEPLVITSYGEGDRPCLLDTTLFYWWQNGPATSSMDHLAIVGIAFHSNYATAPNSVTNEKGVAFSGRMSDILIEDCYVTGHSTGLHLQRVLAQADENSQITIRRNVFVDAVGIGVLANGINGMMVEENVFDSNGLVDANKFRHNIYVREINNLTIRNNIFARGSNFGTKLSSDLVEGFTNFVVENNLYYDNGIGIDHSKGAGNDIQTTFTHSNGLIKDNVFTMPGRLFADGTKQDLIGWVLNNRAIEYAGNLFVHKPAFSGNTIIAWGEHHQDITVRGSVVFNWDVGPGRDSTYYLQRNQEKIDNYTFDDNEIDLPAETYVDPTRTVGSYNATLGGANDAADFLASARLQSKANWNTAYTAAPVNDYIRAGFAHATIPEPTPPATRQQILDAIDALRALVETLPDTP